MTDISSSHKPVALITGANKGIGFEIARQLGKDHGMIVLLGVRDETRGREAAAKLTAQGIDARPVRLDVTGSESIAAAARQIGQDFEGRLDVLVNNAGIALDTSAPSQSDLKAIRATYETNVFGVFAVTQAMLPLLKRAPAARIVNMSSGLGSLAQNSDPNYDYSKVRLLAYNSSKAALNMQTVLLAAELKEEGTSIKVNAADPGYTATDLNDNRGTRTVEQGARIAVRLATLSADGPTGGFFNDQGRVPW
ncbi:MAG: hypothetical protein JWR26_4692 [Pedosphaera sp.]|nr:hypothetical protein [Pedosphaera sp.]